MRARPEEPPCKRNHDEYFREERQTRMRKTQIACLLTSVVILSAAPSAPAGTNVAVFNFQMKSATPEWKWLEKGLADRVITDLHQEPSVTVVQRDVMQQLAEEMDWVPEMMQDHGRLAEIRKKLKPDYLVSGVYELVGGKLTMTAVVVDFDTNKEVARRKVTGKPDEAMKLIRRFSASLLNWLTKRPVEKILKELPVWTRSIPAARALYEGVHLYDQGRYGEAWLKFRQAAGKDEAYVEAQYWVGRMYYFMDRYLHARRAYERFVYMDSAHPRTGDAIKEYLHTYEKLDTPPETLLELYADFIRRHPDVLVYNEMDTKRPVSNQVWLKLRTAKVLGQIGRYEEAIQLAVAVHQTLCHAGLWGTWPWRVAMQNIIAHNMETGKVVFPKSLVDRSWRGLKGPHLIFKPGQNEAVARMDRIYKGQGVYQKDRRIKWFGGQCTFDIVAPEGYAFKKLHLYPLLTGDGTVTISLQREVSSDSGFASKVPIAKAKKEGVLFERLLRSSVLSVHFSYRPMDIWIDPKIRLEGIRAVAEMEKVGVCGMIDVACTNASHFKVDIDGRRGRKYQGRISMVPPGEHTLRFYGASLWGNDYGEWITKVSVKPGKVTRVVGRLPWKKDSPWASWDVSALVGRDYHGHFLCLQKTLSTPCVQADDEAIRVVWSWDGDLWSSISTDGRKFSRPRKLPIPVSSGWIEEYPRLIRDESGRFLLAFKSDRNALRHRCVYVCWSRDFVHWSEPVMVVDRDVKHYDILQDRHGRFVWVDAQAAKKTATARYRRDYSFTVTIQVSRDAYRWKKVATLPLEEWPRFVGVIPREDGRYELIAADDSFEGSKRFNFDRELRIWRYMSTDLKRWSKPESVGHVRYSDARDVSAFRSNGRTVVVMSDWGFRLLKETEEGHWQISKRTYGPAAYGGTMYYHPKWGYMVIWMDQPWSHRLNPGSGPYLIRGRSIKQFFSRKKKPTTSVAGKAEAGSFSEKGEGK